MQKYRILHNIYCTGNDQRQRLVLNIQDATLRIGLLYHVRLLNTDDSHINNYSSKPSMFMKHLLEKELKKYLKSTNILKTHLMNTIQLKDVILSQCDTKISPTSFPRHVWSLIILIHYCAKSISGCQRQQTS